MNVLVGIDGSNVSRDALDYALDRFSGEDITVAHVAVPELKWGGFYESMDTAAERGDAILERAEDLAGDHGVDVDTELLEGDPALALVDYAEDYDFDLVVVAHRGTTERRSDLLGSVAQEVAEKADTSVLVVRTKARAG